MKEFKNLDVISQTKVMYTRCTDEDGQEKRVPMCYILLREQGGSDNLKDEFWCKMIGETALQQFNPGQKVAVQLHFHTYGNSYKRMQRIKNLNIRKVKQQK